MALPSAIGRALYITFAALIIDISIKPVFGDPKYNSYPLSTYPIFAAKRETNWLA